MKNWERDKARVDRYWLDVESIIRKAAGHIVSVSPASIEEDALLARDYVCASGAIACRLRPDKYQRRYRDITIRSRRPQYNGAARETELSKMEKGLVRWMLYGWCTDAEIDEWVVVDVERVIQCGLHNGKNEVANHDGSSWFIAISITELFRVGAVVDSRLASEVLR